MPAWCRLTLPHLFLPSSQVTNGSVTCMKAAKTKKMTQPDWFPEAKVFCNGEQVMSMGGTQDNYVVDIWSGNHPFYLGKSSSMMTNAGQVSRFADKFGDLGAMSEVETIDGVTNTGAGKEGASTKKVEPKAE